jgi:hypothetical protein
VQNAIASVQRKAGPEAQIQRTSLPAPTAYDSAHENWILEGLRRGRTQVKVFIDPNIESSVGIKGAREVVEDLNTTLRGLHAALQFVLVTVPGPYTIHVGSAYDWMNKNTVPTSGRSDGPEPAKEPYALVFRRELKPEWSRFAMERSQDAYKNTLMHELLHHLGLGHAYTWMGPEGKKVKSYAVDTRKTQMIGDQETGPPNTEPWDLRDAQYRGVPAADRAQLEKLLRPYRRARL